MLRGEALNDICVFCSSCCWLDCVFQAQRIVPGCEEYVFLCIQMHEDIIASERRVLRASDFGVRRRVSFRFVTALYDVD